MDSRRAEHRWSSSKYSLGKIQSEIFEAFKKYEKEDGVLGVECSNHSVPTIFFNDLAQSEKVGLFHAWGIMREHPVFLLKMVSGSPRELIALDAHSAKGCDVGLHGVMQSYTHDCTNAPMHARCR
ncbi:hypothetical protein A1354_25710 [Pseudomonas asplenii]|nr:hypothetical protein A1354_25710 [Pseudomonas asplenii]